MSIQTDTNSLTFHPRDPAGCRAVMGAFPTGVTVMTAQQGGARVGCTVSSFNTVSLDPPLILWSLALNAPSLATFRSADHFAVNILAATQRTLPCTSRAGPRTSSQGLRP